MKKKTKEKIIVVICVIFAVVGIMTVLYISQIGSSGVLKRADIKVNSEERSDSNEVNTPIKKQYNYWGDYSFESDSLGIFNEFGMHWVQVNSYGEYVDYLQKIKEVYNIDENTMQEKTGIDEGFFEEGKLAFVEYSDNFQNFTSVNLGRKKSESTIISSINVVKSESEIIEDSIKSYLHILTVDKNTSFEEPTVQFDTIQRTNRTETSPHIDIFMGKPIIYLYPENNINVNVNLLNKDKIICSYPKYTTGWNVFAKPNGDLTDLDTGRNLYALYYESENVCDFKVEDDGFVVKSDEVAEFLEEKLSILGLTDREAEEFIVYWLPKLEANKYNYIRFATKEEINNNMPLDIEPNPSTIIRVLMTYKGLEEPIEVEEQNLEKTERNGFVVVEWGGTEIK